MGLTDVVLTAAAAAAATTEVVAASISDSGLCDAANMDGVVGVVAVAPASVAFIAVVGGSPLLHAIEQ